MPITVDVPEVGEIEFPDGLAPEKIRDTIDAKFFPERFRERTASMQPAMAGEELAASKAVAALPTAGTPAEQKTLADANDYAELKKRLDAVPQGKRFEFMLSEWRNRGIPDPQNKELDVFDSSHPEIFPRFGAQKGLLAQTGAEVANFAAGAADFMLSTDGLTMMATGYIPGAGGLALKNAAYAAFTGDLIKQSGQSAAQVGDALGRGDRQAVIGGVIAALAMPWAAKHTARAAAMVPDLKTQTLVSELNKAPLAVDEIKQGVVPQRLQVEAPATAAALRRTLENVPTEEPPVVEPVAQAETVIEETPKRKPLTDLDRRIMDAEGSIIALEHSRGNERGAGFLDALRDEAKRHGFSDNQYLQMLEEAYSKATAIEIPTERTEDAGQIASPTRLFEPEVRPRVGEETPLRQQGETPTPQGGGAGGEEVAPATESVTAAPENRTVAPETATTAPEIKPLADTPLMRDHAKLKSESPPRSLVAVRLGDFFEFFGEDAVTASKVLDEGKKYSGLTKRNGIQMYGVPYHAAETYLNKLRQTGHTIAIADVTETPTSTKPSVRKITEILKPEPKPPAAETKAPMGETKAAVEETKPPIEFEYPAPDTPEAAAIEKSASEAYAREEVLVEKRGELIKQADQARSGTKKEELLKARAQKAREAVWEEEKRNAPIHDKRRFMYLEHLVRAGDPAQKMAALPELLRQRSERITKRADKLLEKGDKHEAYKAYDEARALGNRAKQLSEDAYKKLNTEVSDVLEKAGATKEEAQFEAMQIVNMQMSYPGMKAVREAPLRMKAIEEERIKQRFEKEAKALMDEYGIIHDDRINNRLRSALPDEGRAREVLNAFRAQYESDKQAKIKAEESAKKKSEEAQAVELEKARELDKAGKLKWVSVGSEEQGRHWKAVEGKPVKLTSDSEHLYFLHGGMKGGWAVTEETTGLAVGHGKTQADAKQMANDRITRAGTNYKKMVSDAAKGNPPKPSLEASIGAGAQQAVSRAGQVGSILFWRKRGKPTATGVLPPAGLQQPLPAPPNSGFGGALPPTGGAPPQPPGVPPPPPRALTAQPIGARVAQSAVQAKRSWQKIVHTIDVVEKGFDQWFTRRTSAEYSDISQLLDAAHTVAHEIGRQTGNSIRTRLPKLIDQEALTFAVQAGEDKLNLLQFERQINNAPADYDPALKKRALDAVNQAWRRWDDHDFYEAIFEYTHKNNLQRIQEHKANINTGYWDNYVPQKWDLDLMLGPNDPIVINSGGTGLGTGFTKGRTIANYATGIEAGYPFKTLNAADLLENRVRKGQELIQVGRWADRWRGVNDPFDHRPIITHYIPVTKLSGEIEMTVPAGYRGMHLIPGRILPVAVHKGYVALFKALTSESIVRNAEIPAAFLRLTAGLKHKLLLYDTFHGSRMMQAESSLTRSLPSYKRGLSLLEYSDNDLNRAVNADLITQDMADYARSNRADADLLVSNGLNVGRFADNMADMLKRDFFKTKFVNQWIFDKFNRGAMLESALIELRKARLAEPGANDMQLARKVSKNVNTMFGNLSRQGLFKSQSARDIANMIFLAPQWVEALGRRELKGSYQLGKAAVQAVAGTQRGTPFGGGMMIGKSHAFRPETVGKGVGTGLLAYFVANQVLNYATRGHPTWENPEEGQKLASWIPDVTGNSQGYFLNTLSVFGEITHDMLKYDEQKGSPMDAAWQIVKNKLGPMPRALYVLGEGEDVFAHKLRDAKDRVSQAAMTVLPLPIIASGWTSQKPGAVQKQLMASAGLKTDWAPTATQQIYDKARRFLEQSGKQKQGVTQTYSDAPYMKMQQALKTDDREGFKQEYQKLRDQKKTTAEIRDHFRKSSVSPFTGSLKDEVKFKRSLTPQEKELYERAKAEKKENYQKFLRFRP